MTENTVRPIKMQPGDDMHLTMLMAPHSLNLVVGEDRAALLAYARDVWTASRKQAMEEAAKLCIEWPTSKANMDVAENYAKVGWVNAVAGVLRSDVPRAIREAGKE